MITLTVKSFLNTYRKVPYVQEHPNLCMLIEEWVKSAPSTWNDAKQSVPIEDGFYIATMDGEIVGEDKPFTGTAEYCNGEWVDDESDYQCVLAWMNMPQTWRAKSEE